MSHKSTTAVGRNWTYLRRVDCRPSRRIAAIAALAALLLSAPAAFAFVDETGGTDDGWAWSAHPTASHIIANNSGDLDSLSIYWTASGSGNVRLGIYSDTDARPEALLASSGSVAQSAGAGWQNISVTGVSIVATTHYWIVEQESAGRAMASGTSIAPASRYYALAYDNLDDPWSHSDTEIANTRSVRFLMTYSAPLSKDVYLSGNSNITYDALETAYCYAPNYACKLWRNNTDVTAAENNTATLIHRGAWNYTASVTGNSTYSLVTVAMPTTGAAAPVYGISIDFITEKMQIVVR